jgi:hypothetical protein
MAIGYWPQNGELHRVDRLIPPRPCFGAATRHFKNRGIILSGLWLRQISILPVNAYQR